MSQEQSDLQDVIYELVVMVRKPLLWHILLKHFLVICFLIFTEWLFAKTLDLPNKSQIRSDGSERLKAETIQGLDDAYLQVC